MSNKTQWQVTEYPHIEGLEDIPIVHIDATTDSEENHSVKNIAFIAGNPLEENKKNATLIVSAVNPCLEINPENPLAVAESIKLMYAICKYLADNGWNAGVTEDAQKVMAKAGGK